MSFAHATTLPRRPQLLALGLVVAALHWLMLISSGADLWRTAPAPPHIRPLQTRVLSAEVPPSTATQAPEAPRPVKRAATQKTVVQPDAALETGLQAVASAELPAPDASDASDASASSEPASDTTPQIVAETVTEAIAEPPAQPASLTTHAQVAKVGNFPNNTQINYNLTGQERGLSYHASGALKWQSKSGPALPRTYAAELRVKAFLVGSRIWRSVGLLNEGGLSPTRYSDSWRGERAAHFESDKQTISFSGNLPSAPLLPGAQDQVSLFVQMAATVSAQSFQPGAELTVQTATARDAANWTLTYKANEFIEVDGQRLETQRWVCLPRGKFDSQIEMWLAKAIGGLPARIKITQVSGNFIDMEMSSAEELLALAD